MTLLHLVRRHLRAGLQTIRTLTHDLSPEQARWKPTPTEWSILEVVNHLYDEEREDFRVRVRQTIEQPDVPLPPIDPEGWVTQRAYNERELMPSLEAFEQERHASLVWLEMLEHTDWDRHLNHSHLAALRVGDVLSAWAGHDMLHIRQLNQLRWQYLTFQASPYSLTYAGEW